MAEGRERGSPEQAVVGSSSINIAWNLRFTHLFIALKFARQKRVRGSEQSSCCPCGTSCSHGSQVQLTGME